MITPEEALEYNSYKAGLIRELDQNFLRYNGQLLEFDIYPESRSGEKKLYAELKRAKKLYAELKSEYEALGWEIRQTNRKTHFLYTPLQTVWIVRKNPQTSLSDS